MWLVRTSLQSNSALFLWLLMAKSMQLVLALAAGVLLNDPVAGGAATVAYDGRVTVVCGGTVTRGGEVASDASGEAVDATTDDVIVGYALEAGVDGQVITIELARGNTLAL
jgi:hypothetical protein